MRKYELTTETKSVDGRTLYRVRRLHDNYIGGFIESEKNLSHDGDCMVYDNSMVYDDAKVSGDAKVSDNSRVYDNSRVCDNSRVSDNSRVCGYSRVCENSKASGNSMISGYSRICGNSTVSGNAMTSGYCVVCDNSTVSGKSKVCGKAMVSGNAMVTGDVIISEFCNNFVFEEHIITITDNHMRIGCQQHLKTEWPNLIEELIEEHRVKHPEVYRSFVKLFCNV
jgi:bifunctional N-acetylglucosamine-1-phosphate-uridyltransferase/glucosamine-1-phosphate-acetyltransferase GlmU-like protein